MMEILITYLSSPSQEEYAPALRAVGNVLSSSAAENIDLFLSRKGLDPLSRLLGPNQAWKVSKEALWCLSNITAGSDEQVQRFLEHPTILDEVFKLMKS